MKPQHFLAQLEQSEFRVQLGRLIDSLLDEQSLFILKELRDSLINEPAFWREEIELAVLRLRELPVFADQPAKYHQLVRLLELCQDNEEYKPILQKLLRDNRTLWAVVKLSKHDAIAANPGVRFQYNFEDRVAEFIKTKANAIFHQSVNRMRAQIRCGKPLYEAANEQYQVLQMKDSVRAAEYCKLLEECLRNDSKLRAFARLLKMELGQTSPDLGALRESRARLM